jgi:hypothetical protein
MIRILEGASTRVVVAEASGKVTAEDYESVLIPAVEGASADGVKLRFLYVLGTEFEGYEGAAALDDAKMGMHFWASFDRIGLVTDHDVIAGLAKALGFLMPGEFKVFPLSERTAAEEWVAADMADPS